MIKTNKTDNNKQIMAKTNTITKNRSKAKINYDINCDSEDRSNVKKAVKKGKKCLKNISEIDDSIIISDDKPNILIKNSRKTNPRKQNLEEKMYSQKMEINSKSIDCHICDQKFENKSILSEHLKNTHDLVELTEEELPFPHLVESNSKSEGRIKCGKCLFQTDSEAEMILHSINHSFIFAETKTAMKFRCPTCNHWFSKALMERHVYIHTSEKPFKCKICEKEFKRRQSLELHKKRHFPQNPDFICELCGASFLTLRGHKNHVESHQSNREKKHICDLCGASFCDKEYLKSHTIRLHQPKNLRRFKCDFHRCRYTTLYHHQLLEHQRTHSDDKPFVCDQCEYSAKSKWSFKKHYRRHTKEKPFKCQICEYSSSLCSNLTRHMRVHTGSKPFKCPHCSYSCNNHENLRKHVLKSKKHVGLHLYNCKHCLFATNSFSELRQHLELNHNDIYTIDQIDRMISSFYHKNEDNTTLMPSISSTDDTTDSKTNETPKSDS